MADGITLGGSFTDPGTLSVSLWVCRVVASTVVTNVVSEAVAGVTGRVVGAVSTSPGSIVVVGAAGRVAAVGTVVSGVTVREILSMRLASSSSGRCCAVAPAACVVPHGGWVCVAFCSAALVLLERWTSTVLVMELLVGE